MQVEVPKPAQEQKQKMEILREISRSDGKFSPRFSFFVFFVPVQVLALPLSFFCSCAGF